MKQIEDLKHKMEKKPKLTKKERKALTEAVSKVDMSGKVQKKDKKTKNLSKKEKRALRTLEKQIEEDQSGLYRISFDPDRERMIDEFLKSIDNQPPAFLLNHLKYHQRLKSTNAPTKASSDQADVSSKLGEEVENFDDDYFYETVDRLKSMPESLPENWKQLPEPVIKHFLSNGEFGELDSFAGPSDQDQNDQRMDVYDDFNRRPADSDNFSSSFTDDRSIFDSMDKYKHLEDTPFKRQFLSVMSGSIQATLEKAVRVNSRLQRNRTLDAEVPHQIRMKSGRQQVRNMLEVRRNLPAYSMQHEILNLINNYQVVLISGETGCGKTTQVAQFILDDAIARGNASLCNIICTQPRRISAISVAQRVADERGEILGRESVGYQIRLEKKIGRRKAAILFCTTGILLQFMQSDPALSKYSHVILDEIHERDIMCDFVLTILKDIISKRTDLKVILMSATLNAEQFSRYFDDCPMINIPGYTHPVEEFYLEDVLNYTKFDFPKKKNSDMDEGFKNSVLPYVEYLRQNRMYPEYVLKELSNPESERINPDLIVELVKVICEQKKDGAILIFMSGMDDINSVSKKITNADFFSPDRFLVIPLHSMLPTTNQRTVFDRPPPGKRKIVIATNIAETSITIDDVVFVIDCGRVKIKNFDVGNNISTLKPEFVSLANARQRRGRAGRVQSGVCYHLFSRGREQALDDYPLPEMMRTRLEEVILNIKLLQLGKVGPFLQRVPDSPDPKAVSLALKLLLDINALDENENFTPLGYHLAKLPLDPQIGKMLLMGVTMSCLVPILSIAATLSFKDPFYLPLNEEKKLNERKLVLDKGHKSDHLIMAEVMDQWERLERKNYKKFCDDNYLVKGNLFQLKDLKLQFAQYLCELGFLPSTDYKQNKFNRNSCNIALIKAVICSGLYPNVAIIDSKTKNKKKITLKTFEDGRVLLHPKSVNAVQPSGFESSFLVYHEKLRSSNIFLHDTTMVPTLPLLIFCHDYYLTTGKKDEVIIELNKRLRFSCTAKVADMIEELKLRLCWLLEYQLSHPGHTSTGSDIELLRVLTNLFTTENDVMMKNNNCEESST
ncbi:ATP-dependent DNA/RNA helicase DHX36-like isoform X2 [Planococcus citri]